MVVMVVVLVMVVMVEVMTTMVTRSIIVIVVNKQVSQFTCAVQFIAQRLLLTTHTTETERALRTLQVNNVTFSTHRTLSTSTYKTHSKPVWLWNKLLVQ